MENFLRRRAGRGEIHRQRASLWYAVAAHLPAIARRLARPGGVIGRPRVSLTSHLGQHGLGQRRGRRPICAAIFGESRATAPSVGHVPALL